MTDARRFVAGKLWLLVAIVTLPLTVLGAVLGGGLGGALVATVGWFLLTPVLLFFGEEVADLFGVEAEADDATADDPLETLKERYAAGELSEAEFERRLERLVELDEADLKHRESAAEEREPERSLER
jgi:uncharacterized membrane protein